MPDVPIPVLVAASALVVIVVVMVMARGNRRKKDSVATYLKEVPKPKTGIQPDDARITSSGGADDEPTLR